MNFKSIEVRPHHVRLNICGTRAKYRDGRKQTAVKVYTVNQESQYLLIQGVPAIGIKEELEAILGHTEYVKALDDYPSEQFTEAYLAKYATFPAAKRAKKHLDEKSFYGGTLHVCYAPEFESVQETREKLQQRRKYVAWKTNSDKPFATKSSFKSKKLPTRSSKPEQSTYIWAGKEYTLPVANQIESVDSSNVPRILSNSTFVPRQVHVESSASGLQLQNIQRFTDGASYQNTISNVRTSLSKTAVPNVRASWKRKKRV